MRTRVCYLLICLACTVLLPAPISYGEKTSFPFTPSATSQKVAGELYRLTANTVKAKGLKEGRHILMYQAGSLWYACNGPKILYPKDTPSMMTVMGAWFPPKTLYPCIVLLNTGDWEFDSPGKHKGALVEIDAVESKCTIKWVAQLTLQKNQRGLLHLNLKDIVFRNFTDGYGFAYIGVVRQWGAHKTWKYNEIYAYSMGAPGPNGGLYRRPKDG